MKQNCYCRFYRELYWGDSVKKRSLVKWRLKHGRGQFTIYCVMKAFTESDQLDIINSDYLTQPYYLKHPAYIYGIAGSYNEALDIVVRISDEAARVGYEGRLRDYLQYRVTK